MSQITVLIVGVVIGVCALSLFDYIRALHKRLEKLEMADKLRVPHKTLDEILDAVALVDLLEHKKKIEDEVETSKKKYEDALLKEVKSRLIKSMSVGTKREK